MNLNELKQVPESEAMEIVVANMRDGHLYNDYIKHGIAKDFLCDVATGIKQIESEKAELLEVMKIAKEAIRQQKCTCSLAGRTCYRCYASEKINQAIAKVERK